MINSAEDHFSKPKGITRFHHERFAPKCESEMVLRTARKGNSVGQKLWGCSGLPQVQILYTAQASSVECRLLDPAMPSGAFNGGALYSFCGQSTLNAHHNRS